MDVDRFRRICGMLGSDHVGERSAAALKATEMLKGAGMTWATVELGKPSSPFAIDHNALSQYWEMMYRGERERSTRLALDIQKIKREVDRLKSMWPQGEPPKVRPRKPKIVQQAEEESLLDYDKILREKIAEAVEACAAGELLLSKKTLEFFRSVMFQPNWSDKQREAVEKTLRWVRGS